MAFGPLCRLVFRSITGVMFHEFCVYWYFKLLLNTLYYNACIISIYMVNDVAIE